MVGSALLRLLQPGSEGRLLTRTRSELDLTRQQQVESFFGDERIDAVYLAKLIAGFAGFEGRIEFDSTMPDGTPRKLLDVGRLEAMGWKAKTGLDEGVRQAYQWMVDHWDNLVTG